jgi:uncharacterized protein (TIGR02118 family)
MIKTYLFLAADDRNPSGDPFAATAEDAAERIARLCPAAVGYVQSRASSEQLDAIDRAAYAGVAELWFPYAADALAVAERPAALGPLWRAGAGAVAAVITGHERIVMRLPEHHRGGFIKGVFPFRRKASLAVADFQRAWWHGHGPIAARTEGALLYVQCHPLAACYDRGPPPYDGVTELHWHSVTAARAAMSSRQMREDQASDAQRFVEPGSVRLLMVEEEVVTAP